MTTTKEPERKRPLQLSTQGKLELKKSVDAGQVRQQFPHGRQKTVQVEVKRKRAITPGGAPAAPKADEQKVAAPAAPAGPSQEEIDAKKKRAAAAAAAAAASAPNLTDGERATRMKVLQEAKIAEQEAAKQAAIEAERRAEEEKRAAEEAKLKAEEDAKHAEEEAKRAAEEAEKAAQEAPEETPETEPAAEAPPPPPMVNPATAEAAAAAPARPRPVRAKEDDAPRKTKGKVAAKAPATPKSKNEPRRRSGKLTISQALDSDDMERVRSMAAVRRAREKERMRAQQMRSEQTKIIREVVVPETITVQELANRMAERGADVIKQLMRMGVMATINQTIDADTAELIVSEFGHKIRRVSEADVEIGLRADEEKDGELLPRPPVVTIMGHVDHGKTSLLDALRATDVAAGEAGGITQHIGAYQVNLPSDQKITFIDTPGHAAFTEMRARGANVTDIVILVVAADDGVKQQTVEALAHAKAAEAPIIIAVNKMDKPDANPTRVFNELLQHEIVVEEMGGDVLAVPVSAKERTNLDKLEETILLQAELLELRANPDRSAEGVIVEAKMEQGRGSVATVLIQKGTINVGDIFVAGKEWGRVRALLDDRGQRVEMAGPSVPVEVLGLQGTPDAGDDFVVVPDEARAREVTDFRQRRAKEMDAAKSGRSTLDQMFAKIQAGETKELPVVIKSDVQGSLEAIQQSLEKMTTDEVTVRILHAGVGGINESDVTLARASNAIIIGFNVRANPQARDTARRDQVDIRYYSIIYNVVDDVKKALSGLLSPEQRETFLGYAEIREVFNITKVGKVAGCYITEGMVRRGSKVRLLRDNVVIHEGKLKTLRRFKEEVREVQNGYECGMAFENYDNIESGDMIECFDVEEVAREL